MKMFKPFSVVFPLAALSVLTVSSLGAIAEPTSPEIAQAETATSLFVKPKYGVNFTTGPGSGYESSYGSFYGWFPFAQNGTSQLFFTEAKAIVDTDSGNWGGNFALGYRNFAGQNIFGGYLGYDIRGLEDWTSHQIGLGLEALNPAWEARLNGYLPVGDRRETISNSTTTTGGTGVITDTQFIESSTAGVSNLQLISETITRKEKVAEESLAGFDIEGGMTLTRWNNGFLKGFLGGYLYDGDNTDTFVGFRGRLLAQVNKNLDLGVGLETDGEFGTNVIFSIGAKFGGASKDSAEPDKAELLASSLQRQSNIAIKRFTEISEARSSETAIALNPDNGDQPWEFLLVDLAGSNNADQLKTIVEGAAANQVVYAENSGVNQNGFTIPAAVKVLSKAPAQTLPVTSDFFTGNVNLPRSGAGDRPELIGNVIFSDGGGELNGFAFNNGSSLFIENINGAFTIANNVVNNSDGDAITANLDGNFTTTINILNNQIDSPSTTTGLQSADAIDVEATGNATVNLLVDGNTITNAQNSGIELETNPDLMSPNSVLNSVITNNTINNSGGDGILFLHNSDVAMTMTVDNNVIDTAGTAGNGITQTPGPPAIDIGTGGFGVGVITLGDGDLDLAITNNQISNTQDAKIGIAANPAFLYLDSTTTGTFLGGAGNTLLGAGDNPAITVFVQGVNAGTSRIDADISGNSLTLGGAGIGDLSALTGINMVGYTLSDYNNGSFTAIAGNNGTVCLNLENNTANAVGGSAYQFVRNNSPQFTGVGFPPFAAAGNPQLIIGTNTGNTGSQVATNLPTTAGTCN
ncbi:inverse autotransporter beta domain-containing protein [[Limnothrix rosea] IAM M-220]|uniref:inverse autotransporter beta domain-containing protein n=1 Tax=[Limnothrix rosea] IAM M-220 TaxID=454133 RepID=UPI00096719C8|nr:inverse autotransporter beta domain-containing protein [[Limnothrix rosea] IAM M-220]OKH15981.1 hypothetical protein NIES208_12430 [[Limnothrix rosea] IAM M-220]